MARGDGDGAAGDSRRECGSWASSQHPGGGCGEGGCGALPLEATSDSDPADADVGHVSDPWQGGVGPAAHARCSGAVGLLHPSSEWRGGARRASSAATILLFYIRLASLQHKELGSSDAHSFRLASAADPNGSGRRRVFSFASAAPHLARHAPRRSPVQHRPIRASRGVSPRPRGHQPSKEHAEAPEQLEGFVGWATVPRTKLTHPVETSS